MESALRTKGNIFNIVKVGDIIEGTILEKHGSRIFINLGPRGTGIIYGREYYEAQDLLKNMEPGTTLLAKVIEPDNEEGYIELSIKEAGREKNWQDIKDIMESSTPLTLKVLDVNKGGLIIEYKGVKGFLPVSQLSSKNYPRVPGGDKERIYEELKKFLGTELTVKIIDVNPIEEKLIFSEKSNESAKIQEKLSKYTVGDTIDGEVTGIVNFGAFVTFDEGLEGLVHISEIDWQLIENPGDVLKIGEKVKAKIIEIGGEKISLSLKALKEDPWTHVNEKFHKGDLIKGTVVKYNSFGAFVKLDAEIQGLLHISEFGTEAKMREDIKLNKEYEFKILSIDAREHRLALGIPANHTAVAEETKEEKTETKVEEEPKAEGTEVKTE